MQLTACTSFSIATSTEGMPIAATSRGRTAQRGTPDPLRRWTHAEHLSARASPRCERGSLCAGTMFLPID
jgi:hypothetical protein